MRPRSCWLRQQPRVSAGTSRGRTGRRDTRRSWRRTGERILADARAAAETERAALLTHAKNETVQARDAAVASLEQERREMRRELAAEARRLAVTIASRLLGRVPAAAVNAALLQSLETWLAQLMPDEVRALAEPGEVLEVATATPLDAPAQAACAEMLARRLARTLALRFDTDPSLIAGVELRGTHARLRNNWRADLDRIAQELSRDDEHAYRGLNRRQDRVSAAPLGPVRRGIRPGSDRGRRDRHDLRPALGAARRTAALRARPARVCVKPLTAT